MVCINVPCQIECEDVGLECVVGGAAKPDKLNASLSFHADRFAACELDLRMIKGEKNEPRSID